MELGNLIFGNSIGGFEIDRNTGWEDILKKIFTKLKCSSYGIEFENETFYIIPYQWGDCECPDEKHLENCKLLKYNFYYKPDDFGICWYKYPLRDSYKNKDIDILEFKKIIDKCIKSLKEIEK